MIILASIGVVPWSVLIPADIIFGIIACAICISDNINALKEVINDEEETSVSETK